MKAIRVHEFGGPEVMKLEDVPDPKPGAGRRARADPRGRRQSGRRLHSRRHVPAQAGTCPTRRARTAPARSKRSARTSRISSRAIASTSPATATRPAGAGTYAERALCTPSQLYRLPARASFAQGAALGVPYATAYRALFQRAGGPRPGETVLVHGATGGVGIACVELAHARGLTVIGSGGTDAGLAVVREHGADVVVNHRAPNYTDEIMRATGGRGVDVIVEMAAHINLDKDLGLLAKGGRVVVVGNRGRVEIDARQAMGRDAAILGMTLFNATDADLVEIHAALIAGLANGTLNPVIGREIPLAEAARAHEAVMEPGALGKIVLVA